MGRPYEGEPCRLEEDVTDRYLDQVDEACLHLVDRHAGEPETIADRRVDHLADAAAARRSAARSRGLPAEEEAE